MFARKLPNRFIVLCVRGPLKAAKALLNLEKYKETCLSGLDILDFYGYIEGGRTSLIVVCIEVK